MSNETKIGFGLIALAALCCAGPLVLSLLLSGAVLAALSATWAEGRPLLVASGAILVAIGAWLFARPHSRKQACRCLATSDGDVCRETE